MKISRLVVPLAVGGIIVSAIMFPLATAIALAAPAMIAGYYIAGFIIDFMTFDDDNRPWYD